MDPEIDSFKDFLPSAGRSSTELSQEGKRAAVLFQALRCGTSQADSEALSFTIKLAPEGVGYDESDGADESVVVTSSKKPRQMTASDFSEAARTLAEPFYRLASSFMDRRTKGLNGLEERGGRFAGNADSDGNFTVSRNVQIVRDRREIIDAMMSAKKAFDAVKDEDDPQSMNIMEVLKEELSSLQSLLKRPSDES
jgi:hypothetical protein